MKTRRSTLKTAGDAATVALLLILFGPLLPGSGTFQALAKEKPAVFPTAILPFEERGAGVEGYGEKASDILYASLASDPDVCLVDRAELKSVLEEFELNLTGMVPQDQATRVGHLTGAKILVTGSVIDVGKSIYLVAKIIGTETSRVLGASVKGKTSDDLAPLVEELATKVGAAISKGGAELVAEEVKREDRIKTLNARIGDAKRPIVFIRIAERHVGQPTIDPAAETELTLCCKECGFEVIDRASGSAGRADVTITGEGFSEFGMRRGNLVSVKARLEVKAADRASEQVLASDREVSVVVDLSEQIAGKNALQQAALEVAQRILPKTVSNWNKLHGRGN